jgi:manganese/iron transport system substrate-binding protein
MATMHGASLRRSFFAVAVLALVSAPFSASCSSGASARNDGKIRVVTSAELFADFIRNVGGERVSVVALVPGHADPHTYEPVPRRVEDVANAQLVIVNGVGLEATLMGLINNNVGKDVSVVEMTAGLSVIGGDAQEPNGNPHLWMNPQYAMHYVEQIRDALIRVDPAGEAVYRANADAYLQQLGALDSEIASAMSSIPPDRRNLVTFHDSFPYFAQRYGLEIAGTVVESPGAEPSAQQMARLEDRIRNDKIRVVFKEPELNAQLLEMAARDAGAKVMTLLNIAYASDVHSYIELMRFDAQQLVDGLGSP